VRRDLLGIRTGSRAPPEGAGARRVKHQSMYETLEMMLLLHEPAIVLKRELSDIPLWGWVARRYGVIPVDRAGGAAALRRMMRAAEAAIAEGRPIVIFPKARASRPASSRRSSRLRRPLPRAEAAGGAGGADSGRLWPRGRFVKRPGSSPSASASRSRRPAARRDRGAVHEAINALDARHDPELGLIEGFFGRPWRWADAAARSASSRPTAIVSISTRPRPTPFSAGAGRSRIPSRARRSSPPFARSAARRCRFGIGLSPFELTSIRTQAGRPLAAKLAELAALEPDDLAILFDDMRGDVPDLAERQAAIVHFAAERTRATRIICCPSYYSDDPILDVAFGDRPPFYLEQLGRLLDPSDPDHVDRRGSSEPRIYVRAPRPRRPDARPQTFPVGQLSGQ
jgi:hypothetical protein